MNFRFTTSVVVASMLLCANSGVGSQSPNQSGDTYTITDLGTLGGSASGANDINAAGLVVGWANTSSDSGTHAFLWQDGVMKDLGTLGGSWSGASGINVSGHVVGTADRTDGASHAFVYQDGTMTDLGAIGARSSNAFAINGSGQIAGWVWRGADPHAFLYRDAAISDLGTFGGSTSGAYAINSRGDVVGWADYPVASRARHAFVYRNGIMTDLGTLGSTYSRAFGINDAGEVVGESTTTDDDDAVLHAFMHRNGAMIDVGTLDGASTYALDINASGQIVGGASRFSPPGETENRRAFLWQDGVMTDLNGLLPPGSGWVLHDATAINDSGQIVGWGSLHNRLRAFLLTPTGHLTARFTVEAETFAGGGQGCWQGPFYCGGAYHDETPGNWGDAQVRPDTDVDLWYDDGGIVIGGLDGLEWVTFQINVPETGRYAVAFRTASPEGRPAESGYVNVGVYGVEGSWVGNQVVPVTGGPGQWHNYVTWTAPSTIFLPAGPQTLTMWAAGGWYNVRSMSFSRTSGQ